MQIGFIGLGIMGGPMAGHLQAGGHSLHTVKHRSRYLRQILMQEQLSTPVRPK